MEKKRAIELLVQTANEIPYLKTLRYDNDEMKLWLDKVGNILRAGLKPEDYSKYWPVSQELEILKGVYEDNIYQEEYLRKITNYEIALKSIIQKYEILGIKGEGDKGGEVEVTNGQLEDRDILDKLKTFYEELKSYKKLLNVEGRLSDKDSLREKLVRKVGALKELVIELTGKQYFVRFNAKYDMWSEAFNISGFSASNTALNFCIQNTNEAIGKLETDIKLGIRDEQGKVIREIQEISSEPPKAFIVHGGKSGVLEKLREFVEALGIKPLIVEMLPSKGMTLADKVKKYQQEADCAIILATRGGIIDTKSGKQHPRLNVIDELSSFWEAFPERVIVLLEKGAELPSNKSGLTYEPFARQSMDRAFIAIARELTEMKILRAVKP